MRAPLCSRRAGRLVFFLALAVLLLLTVLFARQLCPYDPNAQVFETLLPPSAEHLAGTDRLGRDLLSRILMGLRTSVLATLFLVAAVTAAGTAVGVLCGVLGGAADGLLMRVSDVCLAFPSLVFALGVAALLGGGLPNILGPILVTAVLDIGTMMMELAGLSFLGLGAMPPTAELGSMMSDGRSMLQTYPWVVLAPGVAIFAAVAVVNLLGDALRDWLDPKNSARGESQGRTNETARETP